MRRRCVGFRDWEISALLYFFCRFFQRGGLRACVLALIVYRSIAFFFFTFVFLSYTHARVEGGKDNLATLI